VSTFSGLSVGLSSLYAQRAGLELAGHNVANANTEGYSRQRVGMAADGGPITPAIHSTWDGSGNGVTVTGFERMRDVFLESRALQERGVKSQLATGQLVLARVEGIVAEPSDVGIQSQLADFWAGWDDIANKPTDSKSVSSFCRVDRRRCAYAQWRFRITDHQIQLEFRRLIVFVKVVWKSPVNVVVPSTNPDWRLKIQSNNLPNNGWSVRTELFTEQRKSNMGWVVEQRIGFRGWRNRPYITRLRIRALRRRPDNLC